METKKKWYQTSWATILFLIFFFPVGLFLMWKYTGWPKVTKWVVTGVFAFFILVSAFGSDSSKTASSTTQPTSVPEVTQQAQVTVEPTQQEVVKTTTAPTQAKQIAKPTTPPAQSATTSQKNAVRKAQSYLSYSGFSRDGLVAQLEFEKFSHEDAVYGADNSGADWNKEAAEKAKSYMDMQGYSRDGLIQQLLFEKFTQAQAEFGANSVGL